MTMDEIRAYQAEARRFVETAAGRSLHLYRNCLIRETQYESRDEPSDRKMHENSKATKVHYDALVAEIKRLQAVEATGAEP
jgi:hypothetical protein